jgi:hypothetical protein
MSALETLISRVTHQGYPRCLFTSNGLRGLRPMFAPFEGRIFLSQGLAPLKGLPYVARDWAINCSQSRL